MSKFGKFEAETEAALREYYGGFYPTEQWVDTLRPVPRVQMPDMRGNPQLTDLTEALTGEEIGDLKKKAEPYLKVAPEELIGMAPLRNRIAGNSRVMPTTRIAMCPTGDEARLVWRPDDPDRIWCPRGHTVDPFALYPRTGTIEITGPRGDTQEYPYHDAPDGKRIYLYGEYMDSLRVYYLIEAAKTLGMLYRITGDEQYAARAAAILYDFGCAVPHWPKTHRGRPGIAEGDRLRPVREYPVYAGIWYDKYHTGIRHVGDLAQGYDFVVNAPVWEALDRLAEGGDARCVVEADLFLYSVQDAILYDVYYSHPDEALSNYIPYQAQGLILIGRGAGMPELIHYSYWKLREMVLKTLMADYVFPESMSYARQHIYGIKRAAEYGEGYSDPPGFASSIDGRRFDGLDNRTELPQLYRAIETLDTMGYPDGTYMMVHDTYSKLTGGGHPDPQDGRPLIYPAFGHAVLGRGVLEKGHPIQAHLHYSGNWGHDHHDMLNFALWAYTDELIADIGYTWTYRMFATVASGHNLVVVDRETQKRVSVAGDLIGWHPAENGVQVVEASGAMAYPQCRTYQRALFLIPLGEADNVVVDIFQVEGGEVHEWMAQGSCSTDQTLSVSVPTQFFAESYADDGKPFTPPAHSEWEKELHARGLKPRDVNPWYGVFRDVHKGRVEGPFGAEFRAIDREMAGVRLHMLEPVEGDLYTCTVPSIRRCWQKSLGDEDHSLVEKFRMPRVVMRREGEDLRSRFVALWEPMYGTDRVVGVRHVTRDDAGVVALDVRAVTQTGERTAQVFYASDPSRRHTVDGVARMQGRYATVIAGGEGTQVSLYDCTYFQNGALEVQVSARPPLAVEGVTSRGEGRLAVVLDGTWADIPENKPLVFTDPEPVILSQEGSHHRAFPVEAVETAGGRTLLHCTRHPGFAYDRQSGVLKELFTPFQTLEGKAEVRLPSRVWLRSHGEGWQVRTTNAVSIGQHKIERTDRWMSISGG